MADFKLKKIRSSKANSTVVCNTQELQDIGRKLWKVDRSLYRAVQSHFKDLGRVLEAAAKEEARATSEPVANTIKAQTRGMGLKLVSGSPKPLKGSGVGGQAAGMEDSRNRGYWRHPVFGNKNTWVSQKAKPYLRPAVEKNIPAIKKAVEDATATALGDIGFK